MDYLIAIISFIAAFVFSLGGVGAAIIIIPILVSFGIPINIAKPVGLFNNIISLTGASISNIKNKRLDFKVGIPIIIFSFLSAIAGARISQYIPTNVILVLFIVFLIFSGLMFLLFKKKEIKNDQHEIQYIPLSVIGIIAGLLSGLLGIGGGVAISPLMMMLGYPPKKTAAITAFVVPFSSLSAFITYWSMGEINWRLLLIVTVAGTIGANLGTRFMHNKMDPAHVKKILAIIILAMALKLIFSML